MIKKTVVIFIFTFLFFSDIKSQNTDRDVISYIADTSESDVSWFCGRHYGCVLIDTGYLHVEGGKITDGEFVIDLGTLIDEDIDNDLLRLTLENVIRSVEFFNASRYPTAIFSLEKVLNLSGNNYNIAGNLTLKNKTLPINFNCEIIFKDDLILVYSDFIKLDRTKWGINYLSKRFDPEDKEQMHVPDIIELLIHLKANKEKK